MDDRTVKTDSAARRHQLRRRVKRGVVAGYIHEISARHQHDAMRVPAPREPALASRGAA
jgi:hypothetical protein